MEKEVKYPDGSMNSRAIKVEKNLVLIILILFIAIFFIQNASSLTANSSSYSVSMFGTGMATATPSSASYSSVSLLEDKATTRNAESSAYTGNIGFFESVSYHRTVSITSYSISPTSAVVGSTIGLSISALNYQSVWAKIIAPNSQEQTVDLVNGQTVNYLPSPSIVGTYSVTFYANSSTGAIASIVDSFELTEQAAETTPSSGGGGTTTITENCTYIWDCTSWSICSDGKQVRVCKNTGTCVGTEGKPIEQRVCSDALFDVTLKFTDLVITENNTLEFNVDLIERGGIEKIDVQIKYSIIDKDNNEIFSQIETKAIQGELNYDKRIEEVKLENGEYILRVDILYGNLQRAFAEQKFEIRKEELWTSPAKKFTNKLLIISGSLIILLVLIILILMKRRKGKKRSVVYQRKVKHNLRRIRSKSFSVMLVGFIVIGFLAVFRSKFTGFVVGNPIVGNGNWKIIEFVLVIGVLGLFMFLYRSKIKVLFEWARERIKSEYPKNSVRGLIKKRVCTGEGEYIGNVEEIILEGNKIYGLKIKLDKRFNRKGILIKYNCVKGLGQIVITDAKVLEHLKKLQ